MRESITWQRRARDTWDCGCVVCARYYWYRWTNREALQRWVDWADRDLRPCVIFPEVGSGSFWRVWRAGDGDGSAGSSCPEFEELGA